MKYMKLGTKPDTFYTEEAVRSVMSDVPADLIIQVNGTKYLLHKFPLLLKCGLIQRLWSNTDNETSQLVSISVHNIPGGEAAFELCAKFCYGISINLSAHNFVPAISAAKFLQMTESVAKGNLITKLELFFEACILQGWKDSIVTLQSMWRQSGWLDEHRIVQPCLNSVIEKILAHPSQVTWSYTYTRPGYPKKHQRKSTPKDWWTEDVSDLDLDLFRSVISTIRSTRKFPAALIGEALHVYACKHLPSPQEIQEQAQSSSAQTDHTPSKHRHVLESIVSMIPAELGSVSGSFLFRLLKVANCVGASPSIKAELVKRSGRQMDEITANDLIIPSSTNPQSHDFSAVEAVLENYLAQFHRREENERMMVSMTKVGKVYDSYLQITARESTLSVSKFIALAEFLPEIARQEHDGLYQAINIYIEEHPELSKEDRKKLCRLIDCHKLSPETRANAIANDHMPLRTIVQLLFVEQERSVRASSSKEAYAIPSWNEIVNARVAQDDAKRSTDEREGGYRQKESVAGARGEKIRVAPSPSPSEAKTAKDREENIGQFGGKHKTK
ncbi:BTB/POZ domain-containing protein At5g47800-like [Zingiber officinale]|uniref:NPH3 domain-containing protein n=1 Tax=Zingiber officinale TaxID=94328 RepID=A0A8J5LQK4_ZINOF|nr:BTB/POZ domain-containing protein At5g47800-like [Zingiber officinale]XP_042393937.1 BTB/POZ domain-containing protein At5g47800-like [Zingiber officinale]XP_042393943.1 BTB/POZ domain-containing protein At5g47800-like [Zingiber officinale]XP_042393952.1 BTB/POZ domain-containing protein At5g47800-like [Zingiber officinale]XP_042393959.1 BTB/POZ domain-containing protein At5g47800-like [Zingiber officinale]XP_042393967.1 BTB/POZ domain-containing protein At5g47800-like [Zingiber officinale]